MKPITKNDILIKEFIRAAKIINPVAGALAKFAKQYRIEEDKLILVFNNLDYISYLKLDGRVKALSLAAHIAFDFPYKISLIYEKER